MKKKYEIMVDCKKEVFGITLFKIKARASFGIVNKGDEGGYVQSEKNLSQHGDAWVSGNAWVYGDARVSGNAWVYGDAQVYGDARVYGNARVYGDAQGISPLYIQGSKHTLTLSAPHRISIGCQSKTFSQWRKMFKSVGRAEGYTNTEIEEYRSHIEHIISVSLLSEER